MSSESPRYTIRLSMPPRDLSPNARVHWARLARVKKKYKQEAVLLGRHAFQHEGRPPFLDRYEIEYRFFFKVSRRRDPDNYTAMMKAGLDGLVESGLLFDDASEYGLQRPAVFGKTKGRNYVEVRIFEKDSETVIFFLCQKCKKRTARTRAELIEKRWPRCCGALATCVRLTGEGEKWHNPKLKKKSDAI